VKDLEKAVFFVWGLEAAMVRANYGSVEGETHVVPSAAVRKVAGDRRAAANP